MSVAMFVASGVWTLSALGHWFRPAPPKANVSTLRDALGLSNIIVAGLSFWIGMIV